MLHYAGLLRQLSRRLEAERLNTDLTQQQLADTLRVSSSKISRILNGHSPVTWSDLGMLMDVLQVSPGSRELLGQTWANLSDQRPWFSSFADILAPSQIEYFEAAMRADQVRINCTQVPPINVRVLDLQLAMIDPRNHPRWRELHRQIKIDPDQTVARWSLILDESVFLRNFPGRAEQLKYFLRLHTCGARIHVIPFSCGMPAPALQPFSIMSWDEDPEAGFYTLDHVQAPALSVESTVDRFKLEAAWAECLRIATGPEELPGIVERSLRKMEGGFDGPIIDR